MPAGFDVAPPVRGVSLDLREVESRLEAWLRRRFGDPGLAIGALETPGSAGVNNETLLLSIRSEAPELAGLPGLVIRIEPLRTLFPDVDIVVQYRLYAALEAFPSVPTPRTFGLEEDAGVLGRRFFVMERMEGRIPSDIPHSIRSAGLPTCLRASAGRCEAMLCAPWPGSINFRRAIFPSCATMALGVSANSSE